MQDRKVGTKRRRLNDFPELQVGFPERNDVSNPDIELVRRKPDFSAPGGRQERHPGLTGDVRGAKASHA